MIIHYTVTQYLVFMTFLYLSHFDVSVLGSNEHHRTASQASQLFSEQLSFAFDMLDQLGNSCQQLMHMPVRDIPNPDQLLQHGLLVLCLIKHLQAQQQDCSVYPGPRR